MIRKVGTLLFLAFVERLSDRLSKSSITYFRESTLNLTFFEIFLYINVSKLVSISEHG